VITLTKSFTLSSSFYDLCWGESVGECILVVEDEVKVAQAVQTGLENEGYHIVIANRGDTAMRLLNTQAFDLMILDLMLPGMDGIDVLSNLRRYESRLPVLILSARDSIVNRVQGLDSGADDYLTKPFAFPELLARIRVLLRRGKMVDQSHLSLSDLEMDLTKHRVSRKEEVIELTLKEYQLLEYLLRHKNQTVSREMLARVVWELPELYPALSNVIDVHIARLRRKIDDPYHGKLIHTIRGVGFMMNEDP